MPERVLFFRLLEGLVSGPSVPISLLSVGSGVFGRLVNNGIVDHLERSGLLFISSMVLGLLNQLQIF